MTGTDGAREGTRQHDESDSPERALLQRVQAAAQIWLGVLTTLLGLVGSVVLFKGGDLVTEITTNVALQWILISLVGLVFASAVLAVIAGGVATWGGLKGPSDTKDSGLTGKPPKWQELLLTVVLWVALTPKGDRDAAKTKSQKSASAFDASRLEWQAERNRIYLHASRTLGVAAASFIALLAIIAVIAGTFFSVPSEVIMVRSGKTSCVPASTRNSGVTLVVPVNSC
jgi:hypothetical protein